MVKVVVTVVPSCFDSDATGTRSIAESARRRSGAAPGGMPSDWPVKDSTVFKDSDADAGRVMG